MEEDNKAREIVADANLQGEEKQRQVDVNPERYRGQSIVFEDGDEDDAQPANLCCPSLLSCCLSIICPCGWLGSCTVVQERQENVVMVFGKYAGTIKKPGIYVINPMGCSSRPVSVAHMNVDLADIKTVDNRGNPMQISGVVTYRITNSKRAALDVDNPFGFVQTQALSVMKTVIKQYSYDELKSSDDDVNDKLVAELQVRVSKAGIRITNFELTDMSYAKEIAQAMLIRQQAEAMIDARKVIVQGACDIANDAVGYLDKKGLELNRDNQGKLVSNLIVTICGESGVQPTIALN